MWSRRGLLGSALLGGGGLLLPRRARAAARGDRKFVFVVNPGGWDPLCVFAPSFGSPSIEMEPDAVPMTFGGLTLVDHPDRPSVRAFFSDWHARCAVLNGMLVPSVAHAPSQRALMTGSTNASNLGDWPARLAAAGADRYTLPEVVLSGPSYPGDLAGVVCRSGASGQLDQLLSGTVVSDRSGGTYPAGAEANLDAWLAARPGDPAWAQAHTRMQAVKERRSDVVWGSTATIDDQIARAAEILAADLARCVSIGFELWPWDTHASNDTYQSINFEALFVGLRSLLDTLAVTPASSGAMLADEVVVVVVSEMGRTPVHNPSEGRDHWPFTSVLLVGPGLAGDRAYGGVDTIYNGQLVDPASGDVAATGVSVDPAVLGATLLALGDVDPEETLPGVPVLDGMLA